MDPNEPAITAPTSRPNVGPASGRRSLADRAITPAAWRLLRGAFGRPPRQGPSAESDGRPFDESTHRLAADAVERLSPLGEVFVVTPPPTIELGVLADDGRALASAVRSLGRVRAWWGIVSLPGPLKRLRLATRVRISRPGSGVSALHPPTINVTRWYRDGADVRSAHDRDLARLSAPIRTRPARVFAASSAVGSVDDALLPVPEQTPFDEDIARIAEPIDVVYTWVNDQDPAWRARRDAAATTSPDTESSGRDAERFAEGGELRYSLRALHLFAPWIRRIFIVTCGQVPGFLRGDERVRIVAHADILAAEYLPTFNSHAIESALANIDGLAEQFIYLNDDVILARPMEPSALFANTNLPRVFAGDERLLGPSAEPGGRSALDAGRAVQRLSREAFASMPLVLPQHAPFALTRSLMADTEERFADEIAATRGRRFRSSEDVSVAAQLAGWTGVATSRAVLSVWNGAYVGFGGRRDRLELRRLRRDPTIDSVCVNRMTPDIERFLGEWLPLPSPWEAE